MSVVNTPPVKFFAMHHWPRSVGIAEQRADPASRTETAITPTNWMAPSAPAHLMGKRCYLRTEVDAPSAVSVLANSF
jgi:hypothetical protein